MASDSIVDERTLREIYLTGFEMVVKEAQPKTIMSAYNLVNGTYANENAHLLMEILRRDWGFDGAVVTDWGGSNDHALGVKNGSTLEMPAPGGDAIRELMKAVQTGKITEADVDARLEELLELVFTTKAAVDAAPGKFDADAHHALARRAAAQSIVLLKMKTACCPLQRGKGGGHRRLCPDTPLSGCRLQRSQLHQGGFLLGLPCRKRPEQRRLRQGL